MVGFWGRSVPWGGEGGQGGTQIPKTLGGPQVVTEGVLLRVLATNPELEGTL